MWKTEGEDVKAKYLEIYEKNKADYDRDMKAYVEAHGKPEKRKKKNKGDKGKKKDKKEGKKSATK